MEIEIPDSSMPKVQGRRSKMHINEITTDQGVTLTGSNDIGFAAAEHFRTQFQETSQAQSFSTLDHIPVMITAEENALMIDIPEKEEVKHVVMNLNADGAAGPDGFIGMFFQKCWDIVGDDITMAVKIFLLWK